MAGGGHKGWIGCFCLKKRDTHKERERKRCLKKKGIINIK